MKRAWLLGVLVLAGCTTSPVKLEYQVVKGLMGGETAALKSVSIDPHFYGRGCIDFTVSPDGEVAITTMQDGTSDWAGVRAAYATAPEIVAALVTVVSGPMDVIKGLLGLPQRELPTPSTVHGCDGLFED